MTVGGGLGGKPPGTPCLPHLSPLAPAEVKAGGGSLLLDDLGDEGGREETVWGALGEAPVHTFPLDLKAQLGFGDQR